jgi:hypothetical protein
MAYDIRKTNNDPGATVEDASLNTKFDITLIGKNFAGYGLAQNTNFLQLLENFSHNAPPAKAINGQVWYDNASKRLKVNAGTAELKAWKTVGIIESSANIDEPTTLTTNDFWWDTTYNNLYCKTASGKELIGGTLAGVATAMKVRTVKDTNSVDRDIIEAVIDNEVAFVISNVEFEVHLSESIQTLFPIIKQGVTSNAFDDTTNSSPDYKFWGTASDSDSLGGIPSAEYISTINRYFSNDGLTIGNSTKKLYIYNDTDSTSDTEGYPIIENKHADKIIFKTKGLTETKTALEIKGADLLPGTASTSNIGASDAKFNNVYADSFKGIADGADTVLVGDSYVSADVQPTEGTVAVRTDAEYKITKINAYDPDTDIVTVNMPHETSGAVTFSVRNYDTGLTLTGFTATLILGSDTFTSSMITEDLIGCEILQTNTIGGEFGFKTLPSGSIRANYFIGKASSSGGDVAEKYVADTEYDEGSVLMIGGEKEVTAAKYGNRALGALSINPSLAMNDDLANGTLVALKGRVPVKVIGSVKKGDHLIAADTGVATALTNSNDSWLIFAVSLEDNDSESIKIVESVIL